MLSLAEAWVIIPQGANAILDVRFCRCNKNEQHIPKLSLGACLG